MKTPANRPKGIRTSGDGARLPLALPTVPSAYGTGKETCGIPAPDPGSPVSAVGRLENGAGSPPPAFSARAAGLPEARHLRGGRLRGLLRGLQTAASFRMFPHRPRKLAADPLPLDMSGLKALGFLNQAPVAAKRPLASLRTLAINRTNPLLYPEKPP